jgi:hypothetical protein
MQVFGPVHSQEHDSEFHALLQGQSSGSHMKATWAEVEISHESEFFSYYSKKKSSAHLQPGESQTSKKFSSWIFQNDLQLERNLVTQAIIQRFLYRNFLSSVSRLTILIKCISGYTNGVSTGQL